MCTYLFNIFCTFISITLYGTVSHDQAMKKAKEEYRKYQEITLSPVEEEYLKSINGVSKEVKKRKRNIR